MTILLHIYWVYSIPAPRVPETPKPHQWKKYVPRVVSFPLFSFSWATTGICQPSWVPLPTYSASKCLTLSQFPHNHLGVRGGEGGGRPSSFEKILSFGELSGVSDAWRHSKCAFQDLRGHWHTISPQNSLSSLTPTSNPFPTHPRTWTLGKQSNSAPCSKTTPPPPPPPKGEAHDAEIKATARPLHGQTGRSPAGVLLMPPRRS